MLPVKMTRAEYQAKYGTAPAVPGASTTQTTTTPSVTPVKMTRAEYQSKYGIAPTPVSTPVATEAPVEKKPGWAGEMVKGLISAPATLLARPFQAGAELLGASAEDVNKFTKKYTGDIVAPVPQNFADVKKDVGRGVETVALGLSPIAGGAAFGLGGSLEQGNDLFSTQTLLQSVVGAGAGKVIGLIGKPLMDVTGKVIGTITPKILKDVAMQGADSVAKFAAQHEILPAIGKSAVNKLEVGANAVDKGVNKLFTGGKGGISKAISSQYPGLSKDSITKRFEKIEQDALIKPTKTSGATFKESTKIYNDAKNQGYDLGEVATKNKIYNKDLVADGKYNTLDTVNNLRKETAGNGPDLLRPALKEAEAGVRSIPISELRDQMKAEIGRISKSKITATDRQKMLDAIDRNYGDASPEALAHPNGYTITDLYDSKIANANKVTKGGFANPLNAQTKTSNTYYKTQSSVFRKNFLSNTPKELGADAFEKELQQRFMLADYLQNLNGKKAPTSLFQGALKTGAKVAGAALGGSTGNVFGAFGGYHAGGMAVDSFMNASNPVKGAFLREVKITNPEIFDAIRAYIGDQEVARLARLQLPSGGKNIAPDLMKMQNATGAVEMGMPNRPITPGQTMANDFTQNKSIFGNTKQLSAPSSRTIVPNTQGTPNQTGVDYGTNREPGGMYQRIFNGGGEVKPVSRVDFSKKIPISNEFEIPGKKFMIATTDNPMGVARSDSLNTQEMAKFRKFMDDNNIHYTPQKGKYGGNPENSNIIEIDNPQQRAVIDRYLQGTNPQAENIIVVNGKAVRYDPRTKEAFQVDIVDKDLSLNSGQDDFYSEVAGKKYSFPLYSDEETPLAIEEFKKLYNK